LIYGYLGKDPKDLILYWSCKNTKWNRRSSVRMFTQW